MDMQTGKKISSSETVNAITQEILRGAIDRNDSNGAIESAVYDIGLFMQAQRVYILEQEDDKMYNTYEWVAEGTESQKELLQDVPVKLVQEWYDYFKKYKLLIIKTEADIENIKNNYPIIYQYIQAQNIKTMVAAPLIENNTYVGYYGIDNPTPDNIEECSNMLELLAFFAISVIRRRKVEQMTYTDQLTGFGNRYAFYRYIENCNKNMKLGVVYCDVVGLKNMNDSQGHEAGDKLLLEVSYCMKAAFDIYELFRVGGDEFIIICSDISKNALEIRTARLKHAVSELGYVLSVGASWHEEGWTGVNFDKIVKEAEKEMYKAKRTYYQFSHAQRSENDEKSENITSKSWDNGQEAGSHYIERVHFCQDDAAYISPLQQKEIDSLLATNHGVGMIAGYFDEDYTIHFISDLALAALGYQYYHDFIRQTRKQMVNLFANAKEQVVFEECIDSKIEGGWFINLISKQWSTVEVCAQGTITKDNAGNRMWMISIRRMTNPFKVFNVDHRNILNEMDDMGVMVFSLKDKRLLYCNEFIAKTTPIAKTGMLASEIWEQVPTQAELVGEKAKGFIIRYDSVFGDVVVMSIKRITWRDDTAALLIRVVPCKQTESVTKKQLTENIAMSDALYWNNQLMYNSNGGGYKDYLTGGYNRMGFVHRVEYMLKQQGAKLANYAVLYVNVKDFKAINSIFNSEGGDNLLREIFKNIRESKIKPVLSARKDSDHFIFLVEKEKLDFKQLASILEFKWTYAHREMLINCACGVYFLTDEDTDILEAIGRATLAKSYVKDVYVQPYAVFNDFMEKEYVQRTDILSTYDRAIKNKEFQVYLQPVVDIKTGKMVSAEALIRWHHPEKGLVLPSVFIPILEEYGYITKLDYYVMNCIYDYLQKRQKEGLSLVPISINLSRMDFYDNWLMNEIKVKAETTTLPANVIRYEITETAYNSIEDHKHDFLDVVHKNGIKVLLDDFGSGYSSFGMIKNFDFDILKLDMSFIRQVEVNPKVRSIINTIITMCHDLNIEVVAEGVESNKEIDFLKSKNCDYVQGYYFSKPLTIEQFDKFIQLHFDV